MGSQITFFQNHSAVLEIKIQDDHLAVEATVVSEIPTEENLYEKGSKDRVENIGNDFR